VVYEPPCSLLPAAARRGLRDSGPDSRAVHSAEPRLTRWMADWSVYWSAARCSTPRIYVARLIRLSCMIYSELVGQGALRPAAARRSGSTSDHRDGRLDVVTISTRRHLSACVVCPSVRLPTTLLLQPAPGVCCTVGSGSRRSPRPSLHGDKLTHRQRVNHNLYAFIASGLLYAQSVLLVVGWMLE